LLGCFTDNSCGKCGPCFWASAEYLLWWVKDAPIHTPLITVGNPAGVNPGALNDPTTGVLFAGGNQGFDGLSGMRITVGGWLERCQTFGLEGSIFFLERGSNSLGVRSDPTGASILAVPAFNADLPGEVAVPVIPGGAVVISNNVRVWGAEINGVFNLLHNDCYHGQVLLGFRYFELEENLNLTTTTDAALGFPGIPLPGVMSLTDNFQTRNQFYGGQIGAKVGGKWGCFTADVISKVALGSMQETVNISGVKTANFGTFIATAPGGIFAQPSNIGKRTQSEFAVIPELQLQLGYEITQHFRVFAGYNLIYVSNVVRPGDQIDRTVSFNQLAGLPPTSTPARPLPLFNTTDFWVHGVNFGLEFRW
jgi:hypothetical protein